MLVYQKLATDMSRKDDMPLYRDFPKEDEVNMWWEQWKQAIFRRKFEEVEWKCSETVLLKSRVKVETGFIWGRTRRVIKKITRVIRSIFKAKKLSCNW